MEQSLAKKFVFMALGSTVLAAALGGCVSQQEIMHTNALMDSLVARSMATCPQTEKDLRLALKETSTGTLEKLGSAKAAVCIDPALSTLRHGFFESVPYAGYYNDGKNIVVTLKKTTDPYARPGQAFAPETNAKALHLLFRETDLSKPDIKFAEKHPDACGKRACDTVEWKNPDSFAGVIAKNPAAGLLAAPVVK